MKQPRARPARAAACLSRRPSGAQTPRHGPGGAPGEAVSRATKQPVDLRTYVQSHGGKFPASDWLAVIADRRPGSVHTAVWDAIKKSQGGRVQEEAAARGVVASIARYVISIQTK